MKVFDPRIEWRDPEALTPYSSNAKTHPSEQIDKITDLSKYQWKDAKS